MYISKFVTPEIIFGKGSLNQVGECCSRLGSTRVFLVADRGVMEHGWVERPGFLREAGLAYEIWSNFPKIPVTEVEAGALHYIMTPAVTPFWRSAAAAPWMRQSGGHSFHQQGRIRDYEGIDLDCQTAAALDCGPFHGRVGVRGSQFAMIVDSERKIKMTIISKSPGSRYFYIRSADSFHHQQQGDRPYGHGGTSHAVEAYLSLAA